MILVKFLWKHGWGTSFGRRGEEIRKASWRRCLAIGTWFEGAYRDYLGEGKGVLWGDSWTFKVLKVIGQKVR